MTSSDPSAGSTAATTPTGPGLLLVFSGPSGVGKTSVINGVRRTFDLTFSVSATTRSPTPGEQDGRDYFFLDEPRFLQMRDDGAFLEYARVFDRDWYGTPREPVAAARARGELVVLDIDVQGALQVRGTMPDAVMIFILPPDDDALLARLRGRGREDEAAIQRRFAEAKREIETARESGAYDHLIVNDDLDRCIEEACGLIRSAQAGTGA